jgi:hypothetical protein
MSNFKSFMVYTTETGGKMSVWWANREQYEEAKRTGRLNIEPDQDKPKWVDLKMVAFAPLGDLRDFILDPL